MSPKVSIKIISFFVALILSATLFPGLTNGAVAPATIEFDPVVVGSPPSTVVLKVSNPNTDAMDVSFFLSGGECGFSVFLGDTSLVGADPINLAGGEPINVEVRFEPSDPVACSAQLWVIYAGYGAISVSLSGTGIEAPSVSPTVVIDGRDTSVENKLYEGKYISEWMDECAASARNHGQYVRCVALLTRKMSKAEVLAKEERRAIRKAAAQANIPPKESGLEDLVYNGKPVSAWIEECKESAENNKQYKRCVSHLTKEMKKEGLITRKENRLIRRYAARVKFRSGR